MSGKLYSAIICPFAHRAAIVAKHKGFTGEVINISLKDADYPTWYKDINPREEVPTLELANGKRLSESMLIAQYFDDVLEPKNSLFPPSAEIRRKILAFNSAIESAQWSLYGLLSAQPEEIPAKTASLRAEFDKIMPLFSTTSDFAVGSTFSLADVLFVPFIIRFAYTLPAFTGFDLLEAYPRLRAFRDQCLSIPAVAATTPPPEYFLDGYVGYSKGKPAVYKYALKKGVNCPFSERVELVWEYLTKAEATKATLGYLRTSNMMDVHVVTDLSKESDVPTLTVPYLGGANGSVINSSIAAATFLADRFVDGGLVPSAPEDVLVGRWIVDSAGRVIDEIISFILAKHKGFDINDDVASEIKRVEGFYASSAPGAGKKYLFGDEPSLYDLLIIPFFHRAELLNAEKLAPLAPKLLTAVKAARADSVLGAKLVSADDFFKAE